MRHFRSRACVLLSATIFVAFLGQLLCQPAPKPTGRAPVVQLRANKHEIVLTLPLRGPIPKRTQAHIQLQLLNTDNVVRAQLTQNLDLSPRQKDLTIRFPEPFAKVTPQEMENLHWMRLQYELRSAAGDVLAAGIEALHAPETDPFILTAAAGRVAATGSPYRVQVHVKANNGKPMSGVDVRGNVAWEDDAAGEKKIEARSTTNNAGNATLEFSIPNKVGAEDGDLTVSVRSGLVARSVERSVYFRTPSFLLLDTDKDIYQPGQIVHLRMLRFDSARKAVEKEALDLRIDDEQNTLVFKQTIATNAFGVANIDWQIPENALQGSYQIRAGLAGQDEDWRSVHALKSVRIYRYDLPNFRVSAKADKTYYLPGQNAEVAISAEYLFGKPVTHGKVRVVEESDRTWNFKKQKWEVDEGQVESGELDHDGHFTARFDLSQKHADLARESYSQFQDEDLAAYVTDLTTGRTEQRRFRLRVTKEPIHVYLSDSYSLSYNQKMPPTFYVSTFYADGTPARCKVQLSLSNEDDDEAKKDLKDLSLRTVETNKYGLARIAELKIPEDDERDSLRVDARDSKGLAGHSFERIYSQDDDEGLVEVTTSHTIHKPGDPIEVTLRSSRPDLRLVVQVIREGVVLATQQTRMRGGRAFVTFPYDPRFTDEVAVFAFSLQEEWSPTVLLEAERTVLYPKNRQLDVALRVDKDEHRPGEGATVRFAVRSADKSAMESALGIKVVDQAVEERVRTDSDFGQDDGWGWWRWSLWSSYSESFSGISRSDLDRIDLSEPVPADLDLVAEFLLRSSSRDLLELLEGRSSLNAESAFSRLIEKQFQPLESGMTRWNQAGRTPRDLPELEAVGKELGVDVTNLPDPWGTPYRYELLYQGAQHVLRVTSAGPDKRFGTRDDFTAHRSTRDYFVHSGEILDRACRDFLDKEGRFIRDYKTLQGELLKQGLDFDALRDPWGNRYETQFLISGSYYVIEIRSGGPEPQPKKERNRTVVWTRRDDYFAESRANINKVLTAHLNAGGGYPDNEAVFKEILRKAGVDLDEVRDPWGNRYYSVFRKVAQYSDRIQIRRTSTAGERIGKPVTLFRQDVSLMSAGPDLKQGTPDDFQIGDYAMLISEQSAQEAKPRPVPVTTDLVGGTGAITGTVVDPTGAVIGNATVEATREGTDEKHTTKTDVLGRFEIKDLPPGAYDVRASSSGFRNLEVKAVPVEKTSITEVSFELSLAGMTETVEVSAARATVETSSASVAIYGRNFASMVKLSPGAANVVTKSGTMSTPRLRQDFPETMLWEPALITDRRGRAKLNFKFADSITTWKLTAVASTKTGELGRVEKDLRAFQPFFVEHDPPRILTQGDEIDYPLVLRNYLDKAQTLKAWMKPEPWFTLLGPTEVPVHVDAGDAARAIFRYRTITAITDGKQQVTGANADVSDAAQKPVDVHPFGRPASVTASDIIDRNGALSAVIPEGAIPGSVRARLKIYPNLLAHVVENLEAGLEKPHGCGEQTISSTYPSLLVAEIYSKEEKKPAIALKAQRYLAAGYERLLRYQSESGGFTYWGHGEQPDLSLTAYAVEFLNHAATLIPVDEGVRQGAEQWLLKQQRPDGSWRARWNENSDRDALTTTAYIAGTLRQLEDLSPAKQDDRRAAIAKAFAFLSAHRDLADEPYVIASFALAAQSAGNEKMLASLVDELRKSVHIEGNGAYWVLERNTPFYGWGGTGRLESTALAIRALASIPSRNDTDENLIRQGLLFLLRNEDRDGMWFCGQTTVHVLKAMLSLLEMRPTDANGTLSVRVNGKEAQKIDLPVGQTVVAPLFVDVSTFVAPGSNSIELNSTSEGMMSAQFIADTYVPWGADASVASNPDPRATSALRFSVEYSKTQSTTEDHIECRVHAERLGYRGYGMMLAEVGLPPGADVERESLEDALQGNYAVYRYDVQPDRVILYVWPEAGGSEFSFKFRPRFAMQAETAPSVLYDYYNPEASVTLKPIRFVVGQRSVKDGQ